MLCLQKKRKNVTRKKLAKTRTEKRTRKRKNKSRKKINPVRFSYVTTEHAMLTLNYSEMGALEL
jgi:hypothetical protein